MTAICDCNLTTISRSSNPLLFLYAALRSCCSVSILEEYSSIALIYELTCMHVANSKRALLVGRFYKRCKCSSYIRRELFPCVDGNG